MNNLFHFELPENLIAQEPVSPRDHARLLIFDRETKTIKDDFFYNIGSYLKKNTLIVANNTRVDNCRYLFNGGKTEIFAVESVDDRTVRALVRPGRKFKENSTVELGDGLSARVTSIDKDGLRTLTFSVPRSDKRLVAASHVPLPPYIKQDDTLAEEYQTIYAKNNGSLAAPTAGLHFTTELRREVEHKFGWAEVTLNVGLGTFAPLKDDNFRSGTLHEESYMVDEEVCSLIQAAPHVTAVGTTTLRTLESIEKNSQCRGVTDIFIQPGFAFKRVNSLITNFHLPSTSLLLLIEAFLGSRDDLECIYSHAIREKYRFYSFGDAMLIL